MRRLFKLGPISLAVGFVLSACQEPPPLCLLSGNSVPIVLSDGTTKLMTFDGPIPVIQNPDGSCVVEGSFFQGTTDNRILADYLIAAGRNVTNVEDLRDLRNLSVITFANLPAELLNDYLEDCNEGFYSNAFCEDLYDFMGLY